MSMAARLGDMTAHGGTVVVGCPTVMIGGMPAARVGDMHVCPMMIPGMPPIPHVGGPIALGSFTVLTGSMPQARQSDMAVCVGPPSTVAMGAPTVMVGMGGGGGGGGPMGAMLGAAVSTGRSGLGEAPLARRLPDGRWETTLGAVRIQGEPYFQAQALRELERLRATPTGRARLRSLATSGRRLTVLQAGARGFAVSLRRGSDGALRGLRRADGGAGPGADTVLRYNPGGASSAQQLARGVELADEAAHGRAVAGRRP